MQLVEKHIIRLNHTLYNECDKLCFASKNIYNQALYLIRQEYETTKTYNVLNDSYSYLKDKDCFKQLPQKVAHSNLSSVCCIRKKYRIKMLNSHITFIRQTEGMLRHSIIKPYQKKYSKRYIK